MVTTINPLSTQIVTVKSEHLTEILLLNENAIPHVNKVGQEFFQAQLGSSPYFRAILSAGSVKAFLLGMSEAASYQSLNFLWFQKRYPKFVYVDRIVVHEKFHRTGLASTLYDDFNKLAEQRNCPMACEVNIHPPNPISIQFHQSFGFKEVGQQNIQDGEKRVSLMLKNIDG